MVLASGASLMFPQKKCLIVDVGTCVTYDFISENNEYWGGAISPGIRLRYEALHNFTENPSLLIQNLLLAVEKTITLWPFQLHYPDQP